MKAQSKELISMLILSNLNATQLKFAYKNGHGNFAINIVAIPNFNQNEFKQFVKIIALADDLQTVGGYINSILRTVYNSVYKFETELIPKDDNDKAIKKDLKNFARRMVKYHDFLNKVVDVDPIDEVKEEVQEVVQEVSEPTETPFESNEIIKDFQKCDIHRLIPTQVSPIWENCKLDLRIGYQFNYRGMPLQVYEVDNIGNNTVYVIDPVLGLPVTHYDGALADLEYKLSEVFINYLKTIESNKESIVQIASAFKKLKKQAKVVA